MNKNNDAANNGGFIDNDTETCSSIHDFDFELICEYFSSLNRQGPGSDVTTLRALDFISLKSNDNLRIADLGCGTGSSAFVLAQNTSSHIVCVDLFQTFLDKLALRADSLGLGDRMTTVNCSMDELPFNDEEFDVIWSEGAIYNIGFERGLSLWHKHLKSNGYIAVTDATWLTPERPREIADFWNDAYPAITTIGDNVNTITRCGYKPIAIFTLPDDCWTKEFYAPQRLIQESFLLQHTDNLTARDLAANQRHEAAMFERYHQYYGYVFYIAQKI